MKTLQRESELRSIRVIRMRGLNTLKRIDIGGLVSFENLCLVLELLKIRPRRQRF